MRLIEYYIGVYAPSPLLTQSSVRNWGPYFQETLVVKNINSVTGCRDSKTTKGTQLKKKNWKSIPVGGAMMPMFVL